MGSKKFEEHLKLHDEPLAEIEAIRESTLTQLGTPPKIWDKIKPQTKEFRPAR